MNEKIEPEDGGTDEVERPVNICPFCGADLFQVGIVEAIAGGYSETPIHFENGKRITSLTEIRDFDEQWTKCGRCENRINRAAIEVIEEFERLNPSKGGA